PVAHPDAALRIGPHAARALSLGGWLDDGCRTGLEVDMRDVVASQGGVIDLARGRRGDAIGAAAARSRPHLALPARRIEPTVIAALAGKPDPAVVVEGERVEVDVARIGGQWPHLEGMGLRIDAHDGVLAAVGNP